MKRNNEELKDERERERERERELDTNKKCYQERRGMSILATTKTSKKI